MRKIIIVLVSLSFMSMQTSLRNCTCQDMFTFPDSSFSGVGAFYTVGAGESCCSGTPIGSGSFAETHYSSTGNLELVDACITTGAMAQSYCC